jgi:hypothetical protein
MGEEQAMKKVEKREKLLADIEGNHIINHVA